MNKTGIIFTIIVTSIVLGLLAANMLLDKKSARLSQQVAGTQINTVSPANAGLAVGDIAPDFTVTDIDGNFFRLLENRGKIVILFGVAGWCATCIPEGKVLTKLLKEYGPKGLVVIGVAFTPGDTVEFLKQFQTLGKIAIPLALDTDNVGKKYTLFQLETTYIIDRGGTIVYKDEQNTPIETYQKELKKIL